MSLSLAFNIKSELQFPRRTCTAHITARDREGRTIDDMFSLMC